MPRIQPSVFTELARDRPPLREVPQGLLGLGLPPPPRLGRTRDLPPAFDRLEEESPGAFIGRPFRISEEGSLSDIGEESPGDPVISRRSSGSRADSARASMESAGAEPSVSLHSFHRLQQDACLLFPGRYRWRIKIEAFVFGVGRVSQTSDVFDPYKMLRQR